MQGLLVSLLFLGANYYMWLSIQRIAGGARFLPLMRRSFLVMLVATAVWMTPQNFLPDLTAPPPAGVPRANPSRLTDPETIRHTSATSMISEVLPM